MLAGRQRRFGLRAAHLRRGAERHRVDVGPIRQHFVERGEMRDAVERRVAAGDRRQLDPLRRRDGGDVLVAGDLAEADDGEADGSHAQRPQLSTSGSSRRAISISPARVAGCITGSGARSVSWAMTPPSRISALQAARPHCRFS